MLPGSHSYGQRLIREELSIGERTSGRIKRAGVVVVVVVVVVHLVFERVSEQGRGKERGRERIPSRLHAVSAEPDVGLKIMNP